MIRTAYGVMAISVLSVLSSSAYSSDMLCSSSENVIFSCPLEKGKILSVCATSDHKNGTKIAYRFGTSKILELEITADPLQEPTLVEYNHDLGRREYNTFVRFKTGEFAYTVQRRWDGCPSSPDENCKEDSYFAGVAVYKSGKRIARRECSGISHHWNEELLQRLRVSVSNHWPE